MLAQQEFQEIMPGASTNFAQFIERQAVLGRPLIAEYALRGAAVWVSWALDGLLTLVATWTIIYLACRAPYCRVCRSWYRTTRAGPLAGDKARRLAEAASLPIAEPLDGEQYRLSGCVSGCGPSRLQLACRGPRKSKVVETWLSAAQREQVVRVLDGMG